MLLRIMDSALREDFIRPSNVLAGTGFNTGPDLNPDKAVISQIRGAIGEQTSTRGGIQFHPSNFERLLCRIEEDYHTSRTVSTLEGMKID